jgi:hypothetical protein
MQFVAENFVPVLAPVDITTTLTRTNYVQLAGAQKFAFLVQFGNINSTTAGDTEVVTVEAATAEDGTEAAVAFRYRLSGAVGANTWGAITTADTTGVSIAITDDNKFLWIELDPDELAASDYRVARVVLTDTTDMTNCLVSVMGIVEGRYKQSTHWTTTASASV